MGEYATIIDGPSAGDEVKIGTCENLYYLRFDQRDRVDYDFGIGAELESWRWRFPFPDEDDHEPGSFDDYQRGFRLDGWRIPTDWEGHSSVAFTATAGYVLSIPCPEGVRNQDAGTARVDGITVHRNGFRGGPAIVQQRLHEGQLCTIVMCRACGAKWRIPLELAEELAVLIRSQADREEYTRVYDFENSRYTNDYAMQPVHPDATRREYHAIADRMLAGYTISTTT